MNNDREPVIGIYLYSILGLFSAYIASVRFWLNTRDTENYLEIFNSFDGFGSDANVFEPGFTLLIWLSRLFDQGEEFFLFITALVGVGSKFVAIRKYAPYILLSLISYYAKYYLLHELIQVRIGIAAGIFLLSVKYIEGRNYFKFFLFVAMASLFHYSAVLYVFIYLICSKKISDFWFFLLSGILIAFASILNIQQLLGGFSGYVEKIQIYIDLLEEGVNSEINVFNWEFFIKSFLFGILFYNRNLFRGVIPYFDVWLRALGLSIVLFICLKDIPVFAFRIGELFDVVMIFTLPLIVFVFESRILGYSVFGLFASAIFLNNYFFQGLIFSP